MANKLEVNRGTTYVITVNYQQDGVAADLTGATVFFTVKTAQYSTDATDADALVSKDVISHTNPTAGITQITLDPVDTATITPGKYFYDIKVLDSDGDIYKIDEGKIVIDGSPTNRLA